MQADLTGGSSSSTLMLQDDGDSASRSLIWQGAITWEWGHRHNITGNFSGRFYSKQLSAASDRWMAAGPACLQAYSQFHGLDAAMQDLRWHVFSHDLCAAQQLRVIMLGVSKVLAHKCMLFGRDGRP